MGDTAARAASGIMVNIKYSCIFNRVFEKQKSTRNGEKNAKMRANQTWGMRVYHPLIYHDWRLRGINYLLRCPKPVRAFPPAAPETRGTVSGY
jgi:hypothetical protein